MNLTCDHGCGSPAALKPYPAYKPSGAEWLGEVPAHWETKRLKWVSRLQRGYDLPADRWIPGSFPVVSSGGIIGSHAESKCTCPGVVLGRCGSTDAVFFVERDFWPHNTSLFVTNFYGNNRKWCYYLLNTISKEDHAGKSAVPAVDRKDLFQIIIAVPPLVEQGTVARYIDHADERIRRCIKAKEKLVELLEEQRQALINEAVTGRVDVRTGQPYPAYKPSGVEWLGEVPAHWDVRRYKQTSAIAYGDSLPNEARRKGLIPVFGSNGPVGFHDAANTNGPCVVIGRKGSFGKVNYSNCPVFAIDTTFFIDDRSSLANLRWTYYLLGQLGLDQVTKDSAIPGLDREDVYASCVPVPPLPEQAAIARYLDDADEHIRCGIRATMRQIELLGEYRTRLISDVVTGKLDVRDAAAALSERDTLSTESAGDRSTGTAATPPSSLDPMPKATLARHSEEQKNGTASHRCGV